MGAVLGVVDPKLGGVYDDVEVVVVIKLGLLCSCEVPEGRPTMRQVVRYLEGEVPLPEVIPAPDGFGGGKKGGGGEFEDFVHSYGTSSFFEGAKTWSSTVDDVEGGFGSSLSLSGGRDEGR